MIKLCTPEECTLCYACTQQCPRNCIEFIPNDKGFYYPAIDADKCIECNRCVNSCHLLTPLSTKEKLEPTVYAAWSNSTYNLSTSSSGGIFSEIASVIIKKNGVVYGVGWKENLALTHIRVDTITDLDLIKGSKYLQSDMANIYSQVKKDLIEDTFVLFCGTPCQVSGLLTYLRQYNRINISKLFTCDFICHGVPQQRIFDQYLKRIKIQRDTLSKVNFRYLKGWGMEMKLFYLNNSSFTVGVDNSFYMKMFNKGYIMNDACYSCVYGSDTYLSDITLGDFWGIEKNKVYPHILRRGVSMIIPNTKKGELMITELSGNKQISLIEENINTIIKNNFNYVNTTHKPKERDEFLIDYFDSNLSNKKLLDKYRLKPSLKDYKTIIRRCIFELTGH